MNCTLQVKLAGNKNIEKYLGLSLGGVEYTATGGGYRIGGREYLGRLAEAAEATSSAFR